MSRELNCPHCGCPLLATPDTVRVPDPEAVELLKQEVEHLRTTVARLRGAGFGRADFTSSRHRQVPGANQTAS